MRKLLFIFLIGTIFGGAVLVPPVGQEWSGRHKTSTLAHRLLEKQEA